MWKFIRNFYLMIALWVFFSVGLIIYVGFIRLQTEAGQFEWTFDGVHHVLKLGK